MQKYGYAAQVVLHSMYCMDAVERSSSSPGAWPLVTVALGYVMAMLDVTVVNVALRSISDELSMTLAGQVWIVDAYTLTFAALLLAGGAMANRFGARAVYAAGIAAFVAASALCAAAASGAELIGARLLQGIAASLFIPSSLGLLARAYPDEHERARVLAVERRVGVCGIRPTRGRPRHHGVGMARHFLAELAAGRVGHMACRPPSRRGAPPSAALASGSTSVRHPCARRAGLRSDPGAERRLGFVARPRGGNHCRTGGHCLRASSAARDSAAAAARTAARRGIPSHQRHRPAHQLSSLRIAILNKDLLPAGAPGGTLPPG